MQSKIQRFNGKILGFVYCPTPSLITRAILDLEWNDFQKQIDVNAKGFFFY